MPYNTPTLETPAFHILSVSGRPKVGKTHLAASAPGDVAIQSLDFGHDGVVQRFMVDREDRKATTFLVAEYSFEVDLTADELLKDKVDADVYQKAADAQAKRVTQQLWQPFVKDYKEAITAPSIRTIIWDRADEVNEMLRLANFGRLERNPQLGYVPVNAEYKQLVRMASQAKKNLVLIHGMDKEYKNVVDEKGREKSVETGNYKRLGNKHADFLVHSFIELDYVEPVWDKTGKQVKPGQRLTKILRARLNPEVDGMVVPSLEWPELMQLLSPDVPMEKWL